MKRGDRVAEGLKKYGNPVVITPKSGAPIQCRASIQPLSVRRIPDSESIGCVGGDPDQTGMLYRTAGLPPGSVLCRRHRHRRKRRGISGNTGKVRHGISKTGLRLGGAAADRRVTQQRRE